MKKKFNIKAKRLFAMQMKECNLPSRQFQNNKTWSTSQDHQRKTM